MPKPTDPDVRLLQAAADPTRLAFLRQLSAEGPTCACSFDEQRQLSQPTISHHLRVLREAGWISGERRGTWIWYSLRPEAAERFAALGSLLRPGAARPAGVLGRPAGPAPETAPFPLGEPEPKPEPEPEPEVEPDSTAPEAPGRVAQPAWRQW